MTAEDDNVWEAIVSSIVSGQDKQNENLLSPEDIAWVDSCLVNNPELSDDGWNALKDALLDIISSEPSSSYNASTSEDNGFAKETGNNPVEMEIGEEAETQITGGIDDNPFSVGVEEEKGKFLRSAIRNNDQMTERAETRQFRGYLQNGGPIFRDKKEDTDSGSSSGLSNEGEFSSENIFRVWDLDTTVVDEDDVVQQLENALAESSLKDFSLPDMDKETFDSIIANMADLSLNSF